MANITITNGIKGTFPAQKAMLAFDLLTITTSTGSKKSYPIKNSIVSLDIVSEHGKKVIVDITLIDGAHFRGETDKKTVHHLTKFVGASPSEASKVVERTKEQSSRDNIIGGVIAGLIIVFLLYNCSGDHPDVLSESSYQSQVPLDPLDGVKAFEIFLADDEQYYKANAAQNADLDKIRKTLVLFDGVAEQIHNAQKSANLSETDIKYLQHTEKRLSALQQKVLPDLRKALRKRAGELLWEHDISVSVSGERNTTITFVSSMFASNAAIKQVQEQLNDVLTQLRFKRSRYQWYKGSESWNYKLDTPKDSEVRMFKFGEFQ